MLVSVQEAVGVLGRGELAVFLAAEPAVAVPCDEAVDGVPEPGREGAPQAEQGVREPQLACDSGSRGRTGVYAAAIDQDHRVGEGAGCGRAGSGEESPRGVGLQRREVEPLAGVVFEDPPHRGVAEVADAVEEDDGAGIVHRANLTGVWGAVQV